jgi:hypothetical protein
MNGRRVENFNEEATECNCGTLLLLKTDADFAHIFCKLLGRVRRSATFDLALAITALKT